MVNMTSPCHNIDERLVLEWLSRVRDCKSPPDVHDVFLNAATGLGAEQAVFVSYLRDDQSHESYHFLLAADPRWCLEYKRMARFASDPWLSYAASHAEPISACAIPVHTAGQQAAVELARRYGLVSVCIAPAPAFGASARVGMLALGSASVGKFDGYGYEKIRLLARALSLELHDWWSRFLRAELINRLSISDFEIEMLRLELAGLGTKTAAIRLGLSEATVNTRWQRLNAKLGVPQRRRAAETASRFGIV